MKDLKVGHLIAWNDNHRRLEIFRMSYKSVSENHASGLELDASLKNP